MYCERLQSTVSVLHIKLASQLYFLAGTEHNLPSCEWEVFSLALELQPKILKKESNPSPYQACATINNALILDIALSPHGQLFFVEYGGCRVSVANPAGKLVARFGHEGRGHHELWTPWALAVSEDNRVFIADTGNRRIVQLTLPGGQL